ncbi:hypothetical protein G7046_g8076 [Stylonectria norvegica]|nr:hypothetical protein G7046_g8076 [Stylonectria norvegica]
MDASSSSGKANAAPSIQRGTRNRRRSRPHRTLTVPADSSSSRMPTTVAEEVKSEPTTFDSLFESFPPFPDSEPEAGEEAQAETSEPAAISQADASSPTSFISTFSPTRVASLLFNRRTTPAEETTTGQTETPTSSAPQPPIFLYCKHAFEDKCRCKTPIKPSDEGDYCLRCWAGDCYGPTPDRIYASQR